MITSDPDLTRICDYAAQLWEAQSGIVLPEHIASRTPQNGRRVYVAVVSLRWPPAPAHGYRPGELTHPCDIWLDRLPYPPEGDSGWEDSCKPGDTCWRSGTTDFLRLA